MARVSCAPHRHTQRIFLHITPHAPTHQRINITKYKIQTTHRRDRPIIQRGQRWGPKKTTTPSYVSFHHTPHLLYPSFFCAAFGAAAPGGELPPYHPGPGGGAAPGGFQKMPWAGLKGTAWGGRRPSRRRQREPFARDGIGTWLPLR